MVFETARRLRMTSHPGTSHGNSAIDVGAEAHVALGESDTRSFSVAESPLSSVLASSVLSLVVTTPSGLAAAAATVSVNAVLVVLDPSETPTVIRTVPMAPDCGVTRTVRDPQLPPNLMFPCRAIVVSEVPPKMYSPQAERKHKFVVEPYGALQVPVGGGSRQERCL